MRSTRHVHPCGLCLSARAVSYVCYCFKFAGMREVGHAKQLLPVQRSSHSAVFLYVPHAVPPHVQVQLMVSEFRTGFSLCCAFFFLALRWGFEVLHGCALCL